MYKVSIDLPKINDSLSLKFSLILVGSSGIKGQQQEQPVYSKFTIGGVDYLRFNPHPFVTLDFNPKRKHGEERDWSRYRSANLTQTMLIRFKKILKDVLESIRIPDMFRMNNGELILNKQLAEQHERGLWANDKFIKLAPIVVQDDSSANVSLYEGIILYINSKDYFVCMTYTEAEVLYEVLDKIDFQTLSMQLITGAVLLKDVESKKKERTFTERPEEDTEDMRPMIRRPSSFDELEEF